MIGPVRYAGTRSKRQATPAVAPMTRAIRNAMAVSVAVLALSAPNAVLAAGNGQLNGCSHDAYSNLRLCSADLLRAEAAGVAPADLTRIADGQTPASVYAADALSGFKGVSERVQIEAFAPIAAAADQVDDLAWIDGAFDPGSAQAGINFVSAGDIASASAAPAALASPPNYTDILVSGNPAVGLDLVDDATSISNYAWIGATASDGTYSAYATGIHARAGLYDTDIASSGMITADAYSAGFLSYATGVFNHAPEGDAHLSNAGEIHARADGGNWAFAFGIYNIASVYNDESSVDNTGLIQASANAINDADFQRAWAAGVRVSSGYAYSSYYGPSEPAGNDYVHLSNDGTILADASIDGSGSNAVAWGAMVQSLNEYGIAQLDNNGTIEASTHATSVGGAYATFADSIGAYATANGNLSAINNHGDVFAKAVVDGFGYARSIAMKAGYISEQNALAAIDNLGSATARSQANGGYASAIGVSTGELGGSQYAQIHNGYDAGIYATADVYQYGIAKATGVSGRSLQGAYVANEGKVVASSNLSNDTNSYDRSYSVALGILATANEAGEARVANIGDVEAFAIAGGTYTNSTAHATGIRADGYDAAAIDNGAFVQAYASSLGDAYAYGAFTNSQHFSYLNNIAGGTIVAVSNAGGYAVAVGGLASGHDTTTLTNYGDIFAEANSVSGHAQAYGAFVYGSYVGIGLLINGGELDARATTGDAGYAQATGASVMANVASVFNDATSSATAIAGAGGTADARGAAAEGMYSAVSNYGDLSAIANAGDEGTANVKGAYSYGYYGSTAYNAGSIVANATATNGIANAFGSYSLGVIFSSYTTNNGSITVSATGDQTQAMGVLNASTYIGNAVTVNDGSISATASGGLADYGEFEAVAFGVYNFAFVYDSIVENNGDIHATALATTPIDDNYGFLVASAVGALALNGYGYGYTSVTNSGTIAAQARVSQGYGQAWGAAVNGQGSYAAVGIVNDGTLSTYAHADIGVVESTGAYAITNGPSAGVVNHGDIVAVARSGNGFSKNVLNYAYATGIEARSNPYSGITTIGNYGSIQVHASSEAAINGAIGIQAGGAATYVTNGAGAEIVATSQADLLGGAFTTGIYAAAVYNIDIVNDGDISLYSHANAYSTHYGNAAAMGIYATANFQGDVSIANNGDIDAIAIADHSISFYQGGAGATGMNGYAKYDANIVNTGSIRAIAQADLGIAAAYGAVSQGKYTANLINAEGASILAYASAGSFASDYSGGRAFAMGSKVHRSADQALAYNAGTIVARAVVTADGGANPMASIATAFGSDVGYNSGIERAQLVNHGDIDASAEADFGYATAYGGFVLTQFESETYNAGEMRALAEAANGNAFAAASYANSIHMAQHGVVCDEYGCDYSNAYYTADDGRAHTENTGLMAATVRAQGGIGYSYGAAVLSGLYSAIDNSGTITARTDADDARAVGAIANSFYGSSLLRNGDLIAAAAYGASANAIGVSILGEVGTVDSGYLGASLDNQGRIVSVADGDVALATGANLVSDSADGVSVTNGGTITAAAYGSDATAIAVAMDSGGLNQLTNTGTISALGDGARIAISSGAAATAQLVNQGTLNGAIVTGYLDDTFENAEGATWFAVGDSNFGGGFDDVVNNGTVVMNDATISLSGAAPAAFAIGPSVGTFAAGDEAFQNFGTLAVSGSANRIEGDLQNDGVVSFVDGETDDVLTVTGDFIGDGALSIDVSGLNAAADRLYVEGGVLDPIHTININLLDLPTAPEVLIPLITSEEALTGTFSLGNVHHVPMGFVSMDFSLNQTSNMVALGLEVTGLSSTGSVASTIAPGVQSLMNAQVGTWRQRVGIVPELGASGDAGVSPWLRAFSDSGDVDPRHSANFGAGGDFGFHQSNHGWEVGLDARPTQHLAIGALVSKSEGTQSVHGAGSDRFDAQSFGLYATWVADNGFYLDVSQRWASVDARLRTQEGAFSAKASAAAFNVESGFKAWSVRGINLVPQLQYTRTRVDDIDALESGGAQLVNDGGVSSRVRLGVAFDTTFQAKGFSWTPYGSLNALRELDGEYEQAIDGALFGTTRTDGTSRMVEMGIGMHRDRLSVTGGVNWTDGGALDSVKGAQLTLRYNW